MAEQRGAKTAGPDFKQMVLACLLGTRSGEWRGREEREGREEIDRGGRRCREGLRRGREGGKRGGEGREGGKEERERREDWRDGGVKGAERVYDKWTRLLTGGLDLTWRMKTHRPEFTKEVCRQTKVYVRHMTRFDAFFTNLVCK